MSTTSEVDQEISRHARKYSFLNAVEHDGRGSLGAVMGKILGEKPELRSKADKVKSIASKELSEINALSPEVQSAKIGIEFPGELERQLTKRKESSKAASEKKPVLPPLENAVMGKVVTRFPPEPNGYMHIGHAKASILGSEYAKLYAGKFIVRFDDTNPAAEKKEYYGAFLESLAWLGMIPDLVRNASDDMPKFYDLASKLMSSNKAYVCSCSQETMRERRAAMVACEHRDQSPEVNLSLWEQMLSGKASESTLRYVGNMNSLNTTMRDPVLFRIVEEPHPLQGNRYLVWPTYD